MLWRTASLFVWCNSLIGTAAVAVSDSPSLPPGYEKWQNYKYTSTNRWYHLGALDIRKAESELWGRPKKYTGLKKGPEEYWWVPKGTTEFLVGKWFEDDEGLPKSTTTMVKTAKKPPSPGKIRDMDKLFDCAIYDAGKGSMCFERKPFEDQEPLSIGPIEVPYKVTEKCSVRWLIHVFLNRHEPSGSMPNFDEFVVEKGVTCRDVGFWTVPVQDGAFQNLRAYNKLDLNKPFRWFEEVWNLLYAAMLSDPLHFIFFGASKNTLSYASYWKSIQEAYDR